MTVITKVKRAAIRIQGLKDSEMDFQLLRMLGTSCNGGSSVGECFSIIDKIADCDPANWTREFHQLAKQAEKQAIDALKKGHKISAKDHFIRASNYYRSAEYYADPFQPEQHKLGLTSFETFNQFTQLLNLPVDCLEIPYEKKWLPGYFMRPNEDKRPKKTIIIISGFDGSNEESYLQFGKLALERGYNVLIASGPGQTSTLRFHPDLKFCHNYEKPIGSIIDYALKQPEVDANKLAILGISFGGYFATRATAYDDRIKAVIANSPIIDLYAYMLAFTGHEVLEPDIYFTTDDLDEIPDTVMSRNQKLLFKALCFKFGVNSFPEYFKKLEQFKLGDAIKNIKCPSFAMMGEGEGNEVLSQAKRFEKNVSGPVTKYIFTIQEGADAHCQLGNIPLSCAIACDWLDETLE